MASFKHLTFLKVLAVIAWADGEMTESEKNILKNFYRTFGLGKDDIRQLNPYLLAPIPKPDQERLFKQLAAELSSQQEKDEIIAELESIANAHRDMKTEENELVEEFVRMLKKLRSPSDRLERYAIFSRLRFSSRPMKKILR